MSEGIIGSGHDWGNVALRCRWWGPDGRRCLHREGHEGGHVTDMAAAERAAEPSLSFDMLRAANVTRCLKWHPAGIGSWSPSDWLTAAMGELGELAGEVKQYNRDRDGLPGNKVAYTPEERAQRMAKEAADVAIYLDLFCAERGIDLGRAIVDKFNEVSERVGFPDRIVLDARPPLAAPDDAAILPPDDQPSRETLFMREVSDVRLTFAQCRKIIEHLWRVLDDAEDCGGGQHSIDLESHDGKVMLALMGEGYPVFVDESAAAKGAPDAPAVP